MPKQIEKLDDKLGNSIITVDGKHHYPILNEGVVNKINELIEVVNEQSEVINKLTRLIDFSELRNEYNRW